MTPLALSRDELRPHGAIAQGCTSCVFFDRCGGFQPKFPLVHTDCFEATCCHRRDCDNVCPNNSRFVERLQEIGGLDSDYLQKLSQASVELPLYVPMLQHSSCRRELLDWPVVALDTYEVLRIRDDGSRKSSVVDAATLRCEYNLRSDVKVILRGVANDLPLEKYWEYRRFKKLPPLMKRMDVILAVGPNYSHFLDVPRTDNLFNRKRQLLCLDEFQTSGLSPVPHLNATQPGDWRFWKSFLIRHDITYVAVEFETGNQKKIEGHRVIAAIAEIQDSIGRPLHPIAIGGTQFLERFAANFDRSTFIDSTPFMKTMFRRRFVRSLFSASWAFRPTSDDEPLDETLTHNLRTYNAWLEFRWKQQQASK